MHNFFEYNTLKSLTNITAFFWSRYKLYKSGVGKNAISIRYFIFLQALDILPKTDEVSEDGYKYNGEDFDDIGSV